MTCPTQAACAWAIWQVHRSCVVNVHAIASVQRDDRGGMLLRLKERKETLPVAAPHHYLFRSM